MTVKEKCKGCIHIKYCVGSATLETDRCFFKITTQEAVWKNPNKWIPITSRPMTEEEKENYKIHPDYRDEFRIFNCKLPDDGQEVLISWGGIVCIDTFVRDNNDGCYFEGVDIDDVDAWMPLPQPYKAEGSDKE